MFKYWYFELLDLLEGSCWFEEQPWNKASALAFVLLPGTAKKKINSPLFCCLLPDHAFCKTAVEQWVSLSFIYISIDLFTNYLLIHALLLHRVTPKFWIRFINVSSRRTSQMTEPDHVCNSATMRREGRAHFCALTHGQRGRSCFKYFY